MPLHLEPLDFRADLQDANAVLIVSCPICPPVSLATADNSAFIDLFEGGLKTPAFENHIQEIRKLLDQRGIRSDVFSSRVPCPAMCLWTKGQRRRLRKRARKYDAVLVLGCESARLSAEQALESDQCRVVLGMRTTGITNATVSLQSPFRITFKNVARVKGNRV
jgi:hypothetical protein